MFTIFLGFKIFFYRVLGKLEISGRFFPAKGELGGRKQLGGSVRVQGEFYFSMSGEIWEEEVESFMW